MDNKEFIQREIDARVKAEMDARAILESASDEKRDISAEEDERFNALVAESETRKGRIEKLQKLDADTKALEEVRSRSGGDGRDNDDRVAVQGESLVIETIRHHIGELARGGDKPREITIDLPFDMKELGEVRAIADFSNSAALYVSDFSTRVAVFQRTMSPWIAQSTVINAGNGRPLILPGLSVDPTTYSPGEGTAITESTPTLGTATATPKSYKTLSYVSAEAEEDEVIDLMQLISKTQGRSLGLSFGTDATAAVLSGGTNGGTASGTGGNGTATVAFFGYEDLLDLKYGAAAPYRLVGSWVMSNGAIKKVRKFKDSQSRYYWQPAIAAGQPDTFDGQAVYEDPGLAAPASATKSVVYGDLSAFVIKQMPLRMAVSTDFLFDKDQVALKTVWRVGGAVPDAAALRYLISANS